MKKLFEKITKWQDETFGESTSLSKLSHLEQEIKELKADIKVLNIDFRLEFADCFFYCLAQRTKKDYHLKISATL